MKKSIILTLAVILLASVGAYADNDRHVAVNQLPEAARTFLAKYFPDKEISYARMERDIVEVKYEVVLTDGSSVEFRRNGEWKDVDCKYSALPAGIVPDMLTKAVASRYPNAKIVKIDRDSRDYELELDNGLDLRFDLKGNLLEIDD